MILPIPDYAPPRYRRACHYKAFIPVNLANFTEPLPGDLARAEAKLETGGKAGPNTREILANIDAMELSIDCATFAQTISVENIVEIHRISMASTFTSMWLVSFGPNRTGSAGMTITLVMLISRHHYRRKCHVSFPISIVLASSKNGYIRGLSNFREGEFTDWLTQFVSVAAQSANLASAYLSEVEKLQHEWRMQLRAAGNPRVDAAASEAMAQLELAGVLIRESQGQRIRAWESRGLLNFLNDLESGIVPR